MKFVVVIVDGAAGWPFEAFGGRTSLEAARTPNLDRLAREGTVGLVHTVPAGMEPSSAVACMSVLGFDPATYYAGRGPIEALALSIELEQGEVALRCNLVTVLDGVMRSYAAGHISSEESHPLIHALQGALGNGRIRFHPGVGFRHILTVRNGAQLVEAECTPPHDIADRPVKRFLPKGPGSDLLLALMERSHQILAEHPVNREREARGALPANQIWPFWPGLQPGRMPSFQQVFGRSAALTTAVDLLRGLARQISIDLLDPPGVTDGLDNDFHGQMAAALASLAAHDVVVAHVEAPDEAAHSGDADGKVRAIELVDGLMLSQLAGVEEELRVLVLPDHPTPLAIRTHVAEPVPFLLWGPGCPANGARRFTEAEAASTGLVIRPGHNLLGRFLA